jgi:hypothetical protein
MARKRDSHEGIRNTQIMKEMFEDEPNLKVVALVFKELLRIYELNKPFRGGIGSYVLVILVHNLLKMREVPINEDYFGQIIEVCTFMTERFEPYATLIASGGTGGVAVNPKQELNLVDPRSKGLLNTAKLRQINEIVQLFNQFKLLLTRIQNDLGGLNLEERKKMKRVFFEQWNVLFRPNDEANKQ